MSSTAAPFSAHTIPQPHPLTSTTLEIRLEPSHGDANRPFAPGSVLFGEVALVVFNERGVRDVKHRISVSAVTLKIFWESSESAFRPLGSRHEARRGEASSGRVMVMVAVATCSLHRYESQGPRAGRSARPSLVRPPGHSLTMSALFPLCLLRVVWRSSREGRVSSRRIRRRSPRVSCGRRALHAQRVRSRLPRGFMVFRGG